MLVALSNPLVFVMPIRFIVIIIIINVIGIRINVIFIFIINFNIFIGNAIITVARVLSMALFSKVASKRFVILVLTLILLLL